MKILPNQQPEYVPPFARHFKELIIYFQQTTRQTCQVSQQK